MNSVVVVLVCAAILLVGYVAYGRWVANKWGIDKNALTPAVRTGRISRRLRASRCLRTNSRQSAVQAP